MTSKSYKIVVTATDGKDTATATISLTVTDQNETPVFHQTYYSVEQDESSVSILVFRLRCFIYEELPILYFFVDVSLQPSITI